MSTTLEAPPPGSLPPMGWDDRPEEVDRILSTMPRPLLRDAAPHLRGKGAGKTVLLYQAWKNVLGEYPNCIPQVEGVCVGRGFEHGTNLRQAIDIDAGMPRVYTPTSHEFIYGAARVLVGGQRGSYQAGATGAWAIKAVTKYGTISRALSGPYSDDLAVKWGAMGPPAEFLAAALEHRFDDEGVLVETTADLEDLIANGHPVPVCSMQGFTLTRDANGFCRASGTWPHCMLICGMRNDAFPGFCIYQSWGMRMPSGPLSLDQPANTFWADYPTVARMLRSRDTFALPGFNGYADIGPLHKKYLIGDMYKGVGLI